MININVVFVDSRYIFNFVSMNLLYIIIWIFFISERNKCFRKVFFSWFCLVKRRFIIIKIEFNRCIFCKWFDSFLLYLLLLVVYWIKYYLDKNLILIFLEILLFLIWVEYLFFFCDFSLKMYIFYRMFLKYMNKKMWRNISL